MVGGPYGFSYSPVGGTLGPGAGENFTLTFSGGQQLGTVSLSGKGPAGLSVSFTPSQLTLTGKQQNATANIQVGQQMAPGNYSVILNASGQAGTTNGTLPVRVVGSPNVLVQLTARGFVAYPPNKAQNNSTLDDTNYIVFVNLTPNNVQIGVPMENAKSPLLHQYDMWTYAFLNEGSREYIDLSDSGFFGYVQVT